MKKIVGFVLAALATLLIASPASADGVISAHEQQVLDELNAGMTIGGKTFPLAAQEINAAESHLKRVELTTAQTNAAISNIQAARTLAASANVDASGATSLEEALRLLPADVANQIKNHVIAAGNAVGVSISFGNGGYSASWGAGTTNSGSTGTTTGTGGVKVTDKKGSTVYTTTSPVKNTGSNYALSGITFISLLIAATGAVFVTRKNKLA